MIKNLHFPHPNKKPNNQKLQNYPTAPNQANRQPTVIQNKTFSQFREELKYVQQQIKTLQTKRQTSKQHQQPNLKGNINQILSLLKLKKLRHVFERKFEEQIRLLNDFYTKKYHQSIFSFCFSCCPLFILKELKYYKFIDDVFQVSISEVEKTQRNTYFYVNLLYVKLFMMLGTVRDRLNQEFSKKLIQAIAVESKQAKVIQRRKKQVGELQEINDVFVMEQQKFKNLNDDDRIVASYIIQSDNPAKIRAKTQPREPLDVSLMKQNYYKEFKKLLHQIETVIANDWKDIINCQEWSSQSYYGFIQINSDPPIKTSLEFKDCKIKTNFLFKDISSSSYDLRTYLVRKSKSKFKNHHYILDPLNQDSVDFSLRFWLSQEERTEKNHKNIDNFLLLTMRIGVKQKIYRSCKMQYKQNTKKWMIRNYVHMSLKEQSLHSLDGEKRENQCDTSYKTLSEAESKMTPEMFWWVNLGSNLIRAIVEVANERIVQNKQNLMGMRKVSSKIKSKNSNNNDLNPESIDRLVRPPSLRKKNYSSANQV